MVLFYKRCISTLFVDKIIRGGTIMSTFTIRFWGTRGSVPAPLVGADVRSKVRENIIMYRDAIRRKGLDLLTTQQIEEFLDQQPFDAVSTYGGNTSCVEVLHRDGHRFVFDMGTGVRELGNALIKEMFERKGLSISFLLSHIHWDHIQGLPFFGPLYVNKNTGIENKWTFYGGTNWQKTAEVCLAGQMDPPTFPVSWKEIEKITASIKCIDVYDMAHFYLAVMSGLTLRCRKLNHPQETYGWRIEPSEGPVIAYTTDNEPFDPAIPDPRLLALAKNADVWITDCQYTKDQYNGMYSIPHHGWGHSYPEAVAATAVQAGVKHVVLFHHDPASTDSAITSMQYHTQKLVKNYGGTTTVTAAYEGLSIEI